MYLSIILDELEKLGAISDEQARRALDRAETLEKNKPTVGQVGRYAGLGAVAGPGIRMVGNVIKKKHPLDFGAGVGKLRGVASEAATGAIASGAIPMIRSHLDRRAEIGTLKTYLKENTPAAPQA